MRKGFILLFLLVLILVSCSDNSEAEPVQEKYPEHIGEIAFDSSLDRAEFQLCDTSQLVQSRLALAYEGGNHILEEECKHRISSSAGEVNYEGFVMARFLINCNKIIGRVRL